MNNPRTLAERIASLPVQVERFRYPAMHGYFAYTATRLVGQKPKLQDWIEIVW